jgi:hypothetical protein
VLLQIGFAHAQAVQAIAVGRFVHQQVRRDARAWMARFFGV